MSAATDQKRKLGLLTSEERVDSSGGADSAFGRQRSARHATEPCFGFGTATRKQAGSINQPGLKPFMTSELTPAAIYNIRGGLGPQNYSRINSEPRW